MCEAGGREHGLVASHPSRDEDSGVGQDDRTWTPQEGASSVLDLGARLLEAHGVAAVGCHGGGVFWGNRVALDLVRPVDDDPSEEELTAILATALRLPGDLDLAEGEEREIEIELSANRALLSLRGRDLTTRCAPVAYLAAQVRNPATWDAFVSEFASFERTAPTADLPTAQLHIDEVPMHGHQLAEGPREGQLRIVRIGTWSSLRKV